MRQPLWTSRRIYESQPYMGDEALAWIKQVRGWWTRWFKRHGLRVYGFREGHYEVKITFKDHNGVWWHCWTGDFRARVTPMMLRKGDPNGPNLYVKYNDLFVEELEHIVLGKEKPWRGVEIIRPGW